MKHSGNQLFTILLVTIFQLLNYSFYALADDDDSLNKPGAAFYAEGRIPGSDLPLGSSLRTTPGGPGKQNFNTFSSMMGDTKPMSRTTAKFVRGIARAKNLRPANPMSLKYQLYQSGKISFKEYQEGSRQMPNLLSLFGARNVKKHRAKNGPTEKFFEDPVFFAILF